MKPTILVLAAVYAPGYLAGGPVGYMKDLFAGMIENPEDAMQLALSFYGPVFILYSIYDGGDR